MSQMITISIIIHNFSLELLHHLSFLGFEVVGLIHEKIGGCCHCVILNYDIFTRLDGFQPTYLTALSVLMQVYSVDG